MSMTGRTGLSHFKITTMPQNRRKFLSSTVLAGTGLMIAPSLLSACRGRKNPLFRISLAQWSLHRTFWDKSLDKDPLDFPVIARQDFGIEAVEYVNQFYPGRARDEKYLAELKKRCEGEGVTSLLIMCDNEGNLGDPDEEKRLEAVTNHHKWVEAAAFLGCHSIRVNARSEGSYEEQMKLAADGLRRLCEYGDRYNINVIVENHGGLSSNAKWLSEVMRTVDHPRVGTLPDFGNFRISADEEYDRYLGVKELMPWAKGVSAKSHEFDEEGNEIHTDFYRMLGIVKDSGYRGYIGIEYEGSGLDEYAGTRATKALLEKAILSVS